MLEFSKEVYENEEASAWINAHRAELGLFESLKEGIDGLVTCSFDALRDEELNKIYDDENNWN